MKKDLIRLAACLLVAACICAGFTGCFSDSNLFGRLKIQQWNDVVLFSTLDGATETATVSEGDADHLKEMLNNRNLYFEEYSCGFSDDFGISVNGRNLWLAEDGCPHFYDSASGKYLSISDEQRVEILSMFSKYGLYAPKY